MLGAAVDTGVLVVVAVGGAEPGSVQGGEAVSQQVGHVGRGVGEQPVSAGGVGDGEDRVLHEDVVPAVVVELGADSQLVLLAGGQQVNLTHTEGIVLQKPRKSGKSITGRTVFFRN